MVPNRTAYEIDADLTAELREESSQELTAYRRGVDYLIEENHEQMDTIRVLRARIEELENERAQDQTTVQGLTIDNRHQEEMIAAIQRSEYAAFIALNMVVDDNGRLSRRLNEHDNVQR
ncbi:hypothetical protein LQW54_007726 [Pestalotiopsis sp. IQ-011]